MTDTATGHVHYGYHAEKETLRSPTDRTADRGIEKMVELRDFLNIGAVSRPRSTASPSRSSTGT